jgi:hypothetical protein
MSGVEVAEHEDIAGSDPAELRVVPAKVAEKYLSLRG